MALQDKYSKLIDFARTNQVKNFSVKEQDNVLYISGDASSWVKNKMWDIYNQIDPDMRAGDLVMDIQVIPGSEEIYEVKSGDSLSKIAKKYPGMTWQKIYEANKETIKNPDLIRPGQKIVIPL